MDASRKHAIMASVEAFKSAVIRIRDILRGPGISVTGMDSMRHICLYLLSRYMTRSRVLSLGVPEELCWENLIDMIRTKNGGAQKALDLFYHPQLKDCLIRHFDRLFDTTDFPFSIKSVQKHKEILEILDGINMADVDCQMDVLGWVYEQHLKTGSSAARDLGQFFTDRSICEYMTQLCEPKLKSSGIPESVCDPSMGTGGFLTTFVKYYKRNFPTKEIDWSIHQKQVHGYDTDSKVAGVARLNLFMETGGTRFTGLFTRDSLYGDLSKKGYDIILANMPFGIKGIKHADCCERVKELRIRGTKSEPLFLQLMMVSLNPGGRCAVVVPDGMLLNNSSCHNLTRKYLLDHMCLRRVIKMKGQFFMNTGIQPSILLFENTGKPTDVIEFWEVMKSDDGQVSESKLLSMPRGKIDDTFSFDMRRYVEIEPTFLNAANYPILSLQEVADASTGRPVPRDQKADDGLYDVMGGGVTYNSKANVYNREGETISISNSGSAGYVAFHNQRYWASENCFTLAAKETTFPRYLFYYLRLNNHLITATTTGSTIPHCRWDSIKNMPICHPPRDTQEEIARTLDRILRSASDVTDVLRMTDRAMGLILMNPDGSTLEPIVNALRLIRHTSQMVAHVKAQISGLIKASMSGYKCTKFSVADLAVVNPENITKADTMESIDYVELGAVKEGIVKDIKMIPFADRPSRAQRKVQNGDILWGTVRPLSRTHAFIDFATSNTVVSTGFIVLRNKNVNVVSSKYLYYALTTNDCVTYLSNKSTGTTYPSFNVVTMVSYEVLIPPKDVQEMVLERVGHLEAQLISLNRLQTQTDGDAKFMLDAFLQQD